MEEEGRRKREHSSDIEVLKSRTPKPIPKKMLLDTGLRLEYGQRDGSLCDGHARRWGRGEEVGGKERGEEVGVTAL